MDKRWQPEEFLNVQQLNLAFPQILRMSNSLQRSNSTDGSKVDLYNPTSNGNLHQDLELPVHTQGIYPTSASHQSNGASLKSIKDEEPIVDSGTDTEGEESTKDPILRDFVHHFKRRKLNKNERTSESNIDEEHSNLPRKIKLNAFKYLVNAKTTNANHFVDIGDTYVSYEDPNYYEDYPEGSEFELPGNSKISERTNGSASERFRKKKQVTPLSYDMVVKKLFPKAYNQYATNQLKNSSYRKLFAYQAQKEVRKLAVKSVRSSGDTANKSRRIAKEMLGYWRKVDKEERENKKKTEREQFERRKKEEEQREATRQQRKLNFLLTQTELYSHFFAKKAKKENAGPGEAPATPMETSGSAIIDPTAEQKADLEAMQNEDTKLSAEQALKATEKALNEHLQRTKMFDDSVNKIREAQLQPPAPNPMISSDVLKQPSMFKGSLKSYQLKGLTWLVDLYDQGINGILADDMGLGKTIQSIAFLAHLAEEKDIWGPFLIVTPSSTLHNWQQEINKFCPHLRSLPYWGTVKERQTIRKFWNPKNLYTKDAPFHVVITSYSLAVLDEKYFHRLKWQYMILDEAQALKSSQSARWKTLLKFNCRNRLLLTGTPVQNAMAELWALLHFIMPTLFDSHEEFNEWFSKDIESHALAQTALNEHQLRRLHMILKPFMLRRVKRDVEQEIAPKIELDVNCELSLRQKKLYQGIKDKISINELLNRKSLSQAHVGRLMNLVMQFRKVCNHPQIFERSDSLAPLQFQDRYYDFSQNSPGVGYMPLINHNPIRYSIPKFLYRNLPKPRGFHSKSLYNLFCIFSPSYIHNSIFHSSSGSSTRPLWTRTPSTCFGFSRMSDLSPADIYRCKFQGELLQYLWVIQFQKRIEQLILYVDTSNGTYPSAPVNTRSKFLILPTMEASKKQSRIICHDNSVAHLTELSTRHFRDLSIEKNSFIYMPPVLAPPIEYLCSDRSFAYEQNEMLNFAHTKSFLTGFNCSGWSPVSTYRNIKAEDFFEEGQLSTMEKVFEVNGSSHIRIPDFAKLISDSGKLQLLDSMLTKLKAEGHKVLVYSQMTKMIDILEDFMWFRKHKYVRLDGSSKLSDRRDLVEDFQTRPDIFVFLLSTRAGGIGINLTAADTVIFYDSDWNPTNDQQAMDRAHRLGQTRQVTVYRIITKGTVEERILKRAKHKQHIQSIVISDVKFQAPSEETLSADEVVSLLLDDNELNSSRAAQAQDAKKKEKDKDKSKSEASSSKKAKVAEVTM